MQLSYIQVVTPNFVFGFECIILEQSSCVLHVYCHIIGILKEHLLPSLTFIHLFNSVIEIVLHY